MIHLKGLRKRYKLIKMMGGTRLPFWYWLPFVLFGKAH